jgi:hypothetical protein
MALTIRNSQELKPFLEKFKASSHVNTDSGAITEMVKDYMRLKDSHRDLNNLYEVALDRINDMRDAQIQLGLSLKPFLDAGNQSESQLDDPSIDWG